MDGVGDYQHVLFCSSGPSAFLENVDQREIVETPALRGPPGLAVGERGLPGPPGLAGGAWEAWYPWAPGPAGSVGEAGRPGERVSLGGWWGVAGGVGLGGAGLPMEHTPALVSAFQGERGEKGERRTGELGRASQAGLPAACAGTGHPFPSSLQGRDGLPGLLDPRTPGPKVITPSSAQACDWCHQEATSGLGPRSSMR